YPLLQYRTITSKTKRPQSEGIQDQGRLINFYFLYCLLDGVQFKLEQYSLGLLFFCYSIMSRLLNSLN
ncbi:hypothetical protein, partial [Paenibacillus sp. SYP-B3998]|uniref:hypothetical protein n=1 Tax=Paenibacillus sp. SYP-B3998 TaxID=2678564 RepID=UPI001F071A71